MPIYEFQCTKCNKKFEKILPISSKEVVYCDCSEKSEAKKAFSKMSSGRKNSRPVLNKFIGMIA